MDFRREMGEESKEQKTEQQVGGQKEQENKF